MRWQFDVGDIITECDASGWSGAVIEERTTLNRQPAYEIRFPDQSTGVINEDLIVGVKRAAPKHAVHDDGPGPVKADTNLQFIDYLRQMRQVHDSKNHDYADVGNPYSNFEGAAQIAGVTVDTVFQVMIGIKLERLRQLVGTDKEANNESVDDSILDLANYAALWGSYRQAIDVVER